MLEQPGALAQRLAHQPQVEVLEIADAAMDQLGRLGRRLRAAAALVEERDLVVLPRQLPGDSGTVDAAADHSNPHGLILSIFHVMAEHLKWNPTDGFAGVFRAA